MVRRREARRHEVGNLLGAARLLVESLRTVRPDARGVVRVPRAQLDSIARAVEELTRLLFPSEPPKVASPRKKKRRRARASPSRPR